MNKIKYIFFGMLWAINLLAQDTITLNLCHELAITNYPLTRQQNLLTDANGLSVMALNKNYLPQMILNGQASYQSDVTKVPIQDIPVFGIEPLSKDWYKIVLDVNQVIYDGSITNRQKDLQETELEISRQELEVELYNLKERINKIYFSILLLKENRRILQLHESTLKSKLKTVESGVENGTVLESNADILKAEIIKIEQSLAELDISRKTAISILNVFTGLELNGNTNFLVPEITIDIETYVNNRPEYSLFSLQQNKLEASKKLINSRNLPQLMAFGQAGYGRPGYDMLKNQFDDFYMIGARLRWNFWDWNKSHKEKEVLDIKKQIIETRKETFDKNIRIDLENKRAEIRKTEEMISRDRQIIELREKISKSASSQLDNNVITSTEYLTELNEESKARFDMEAQKIL
ncbi:MAG: TolC family protein, partial [Bacteroidales bacterium]|nr:TolC family protein [Bacteroidales bacterium]